MSNVRLVAIAIAAILTVATAVVVRAADADRPPVPGEAHQQIDLLAGYWRYTISFSPAGVDTELLRQAAEANLDGLGDRMKARRIDPAKPQPGWPFFMPLANSQLSTVIQSPPPPADWMETDFDDSRWPRQRLPLLTGPRWWQSQTPRLACFRTVLLTADPDKSGVRRLKLNLAFRGGVVVYLNGREIARAFLPDGQITPETPGRTYPRSAYVLEPLGKGPNPEMPRPVPDQRGSPGEFPSLPTSRTRMTKEEIAELAKTLELSPDDIAECHGGLHGRQQYFITRAEWEQVRRERDRRLTQIAIAPGLLRAGANVLAVEIHRSDLNPAASAYWGSLAGAASWQHAYLLSGSLECEPAGAILPEGRATATGVQVWTADIHRRMFARDCPPAQQAHRPIRIVAPRNGSCSGQAVLCSEKPLDGLAATVGDLRGLGGATIAASAVQVRFAGRHPASDFGSLNANAEGGRGSTGNSQTLALLRYGGEETMPVGLDRRQVRAWRKQQLDRIFYFDRLGTRAPSRVAAGTCQPIWVTVNVPRDAVAGQYEGELTITAGQRRLLVPIRVQVMDWLLPDPGEFRTVMALEGSPYGVAAHYKVPLWSDRHFELIDKSLELLSQVGDDFVAVPVLVNSEFGNGEDSMIRWRRNDGGWECDFSNFDRYMKLVNRRLKPRCICLVVCHSSQSAPGWISGKPRVVLAAPEGENRFVEVPPPGSREAIALWRPLVEGLRKRLAGRASEKLPPWHWGYLGDAQPPDVTATIEMLARLAPGIGWARGAHGHGKENSPFSFGTTVRSASRVVARGASGLTVQSAKGWKNDWVRLAFTRVEHPIVVYGPSSAYRFRIAPELATCFGCDGIGRWGADYWGVYTCWGTVAVTVSSVLRPGPDGPQSSARFECLREGVQEAETRIFIERKIEALTPPPPPKGARPGLAAARPLPPAAVAAQKVLDQRLTEELVQSEQSYDNSPQPRIEESHFRWQQRSWELYAAAARLSGGKAPSQADHDRFFGP